MFKKSIRASKLSGPNHPHLWSFVILYKLFIIIIILRYSYLSAYYYYYYYLLDFLEDLQS